MAYVPYLTLQDYQATIQSGQLSQQILDPLQAGTSERLFAEEWAIGIVRSKLKTKYDLDFEITPTLSWDTTKQYHAHDRVILDYDDFVGGKLYMPNSLVCYNGYAWICINQTNAQTFDQSAWQMLGEQYSIWYCAYLDSNKNPIERFSFEVQIQQGAFQKGYYNIGDIVWWQDHTYIALQGTQTISHDDSLNFFQYAELPARNVFPNDPNIGSTVWQDNGEYILDAGEPLTSPVWVLSDNRDILMVQCIVDIALYSLHKRISPMNIPKLREESFIRQMEWLTSLRNGKSDSDLTILEPEQGDEVRWGSNIKQANSY